MFTVEVHLHVIEEGVQRYAKIQDTQVMKQENYIQSIIQIILNN